MEKTILNNPNSRRVRLSREELLSGMCYSGNPQKETDPRIKSSSFVLASELQELEERYKREIDQWKEYQQQIQRWKIQVQQVVNQLKAELNEKDLELKRLRKP